MQEFNTKLTQQYYSQAKPKRHCKYSCYMWQHGMLTVQRQWESKATWNASDNIAKCQEKAATVCDTGLPTMQETQ